MNRESAKRAVEKKRRLLDGTAKNLVLMRGRREYALKMAEEHLRLVEARIAEENRRITNVTIPCTLEESSAVREMVRRVEARRGVVGLKRTEAYRWILLEELPRLEKENVELAEENVKLRERVESLSFRIGQLKEPLSLREKSVMESVVGSLRAGGTVVYERLQKVRKLSMKEDGGGK